MGGIGVTAVALSACWAVCLDIGLAHAGVVRAMPNTPAQIGMSMTVWTCVPGLDESQHGQARAVFGSFGEEVYLDDERYLDMATALSGTGPAYVFIFMEAMVDAGVHMGFSRRVSEQPDVHPESLAGSGLRQAPYGQIRLSGLAILPGKRKVET